MLPFAQRAVVELDIMTAAACAARSVPPAADHRRRSPCDLRLDIVERAELAALRLEADHVDAGGVPDGARSGV